mmetsp:Transcript_6666/g.30120  ORF Transcript_6666/g.30120 Transcript_6666/m.30120 type:complete len:211 (-) Transcript_6666:414-1046(-)
MRSNDLNKPASTVSSLVSTCLLFFSSVMHSSMTCTIASWIFRTRSLRGWRSSITSGACESRHALTVSWNRGQRCNSRVMRYFITWSTLLNPRHNSPGLSVSARRNPARLPERKRRMTNASWDMSVTLWPLATTTPCMLLGGRASRRMSTAAMRVVTNIGPPLRYISSRLVPVTSAVTTGGNGMPCNPQCTLSAALLKSFRPRMRTAPWPT